MFLGVYGQGPISLGNLPMRRDPLTLNTKRMNEIVMCRADAIRDFFKSVGPVDNTVCLDFLQRQNVTCKLGWIAEVRRIMIERGVMPKTVNRKAAKRFGIAVAKVDN
jgi:hypothetical protein